MGVPVARLLAPVLAKPAAKRGFREARLIAEWVQIVGPELARKTRPERLQRQGQQATLTLVVAPGWAVEVQHLLPTIIDRIARYFGYPLVQRVTLRQGSVAEPRAGEGAPVEPSALGEADAAELDAACAEIEDPELAAILRRLGEAVLRR